MNPSCSLQLADVDDAAARKTCSLNYSLLVQYVHREAEKGPIFFCVHLIYLTETGNVFSHTLRKV